MASNTSMTPEEFKEAELESARELNVTDSIAANNTVEDKLGEPTEHFQKGGPRALDLGPHRPKQRKGRTSNSSISSGDRELLIVSFIGSASAADLLHSRIRSIDTSRLGTQGQNAHASVQFELDIHFTMAHTVEGLPAYGPPVARLKGQAKSPALPLLQACEPRAG